MSIGKEEVTVMTKSRKKANKKKRIRDDAQLLTLSAPAIILLLIFCYVPMFGIVIAFKDFKPILGFWDSQWVGFKNFEFLFMSQDFSRLVTNTVGYALIFIALKIVLGVVVALLLYEIVNRKALKFYQTSMIMPNFLSWVVVGYISYILLNPSSGMFNQIIRAFGGEGVSWYSEAKVWPFILPVVNSWKSIGMDSIMFYAALMGLDSELFEAATIDGATKWQQVRKISVPLLAPIVCIIGILAMGNVFRGDFGLFYQIPRNVGALYPTTDVIDTYVMRGVMQGNIGTTASVGLVQSVVGLIMVVGTNLIVKKLDPENSLF